jgi:outer membrane protein assembly factor BamB
MWGRRGVAAAPDGTVYMGTGDGYYNPDTKNLGDSIVAAKMNANHELQITGWFSPPNANWMWHRDLDINVSPIVIDHKGKHLLFGSSKECRVWMVDRDAMNGTEPPFDKHREMLDRTPLICNPGQRYDAAGVWGAMAAWEDPAGTLFVAVPFLGPLTDTYRSPIEIGKPELGGVAVLRVDDTKWKMVPAWTFGDIDQGDEAIYSNGILFVNGAGEDTYQGAGNQSGPDTAWNEAPRPAPLNNRQGNSRHATIYALDAATGKQLWSSANQITSWNHGSGFSAVNGKAYIGTYDGMFYCFGVPGK